MDELSKQLFGQSNITFAYEVGQEAAVKKAERTLFGRNFSAQDYSEMVAAPNSAAVTVDYDRNADEIVIVTTHPYYQEEQVRTIGIVAGKKTMGNVLFGVLRPPAPQGVGARIAARQVEMTRRMKFDQILLYAAGRPGDAFSGYYVWPRLGYNMDIGNMQQVLNIAGFVDVLSTNALMMQPGGAAWWKKNGWSGYCVFDLRPYSLSQTILNDYLERNKIAVSD